MEKSVESPNGEPTTLNVSNLSYTPASKFIKTHLEYIRYKLTLVQLDWLLPFYKGENRKLLLLGAPLRNVNFTAFSGELVALIGTEPERLEIVQLLTGRKKEGTFDGFISLRGSEIPKDSYYYNHVTYVQKKPLFIPGLTYKDMIHYAVALRCDATVDVDQRVDDIITLMNLHRRKNHVIEEFPPTRGDAGCDFRRLGIALEIVTLPPLIVIDEPCLDFDIVVSLKIMDCLKKLTKRGHIVFCSVDKPSQAEFNLFDRAVLLSDGYTIFSAAPSQVDNHFCSAEMGYLRKKDVSLIDFAVDIGSGVERPDTMRVAEHPSVMQEKFEASKLFTSPSHDANNSHAFSPEFFKWFGLVANIQPAGVQLRRFWVVLKRAIYTKIHNRNTMKSLFMASTVLSTIVGYLQYGQGSYGNYCLNLLGVPFKNTTNVGSLIFFLSLFTQAYFFVDAHALCRKLQLFRYEQAAGVNTTPAFFVATVLSEAPAALMFGMVFGSILYSMSQIYGDGSDFGYFISTILMACLVGLSCAVMYCAIFKKELAVRDMFFVSLAIVVLLSGFPFSQPNMPDYLIDFSTIIPTRWIFEALYKWYFSRKLDGKLYLTNYRYNAFDRSELFVILTNFLLVINAITCVAILPELVFMHRKRGSSGGQRTASGESRDSTGSRDSDFDAEHGGKAPPRMSERASEAVQPIMFMRASTVTGRQSKLSVNMSQMGEENTSRGPTVMLNEISLRVRDPSSPLGYKTVLQNISGQFDWGKLNMVLGAPQCGKSSLMNIIAGNLGANAEVGGQVTFNGHAPSANSPIWERCAFVPLHNEHFRDLTVHEIVTFAMKLRCYNSLGLSVVEENVTTTIANLHLEAVANKKVKFLNSGEYKRLSIAEEIVHGPKLLLMDEPITGVSLHESSILMNTFREMVNADRTVVCSMYQPTVEAFNLFDSLLLLSKGRVIYSGRIGAATEFFTNSPYQYSMAGYNNPADFLADVSGAQLADSKGEYIDGSLLENYYMGTENYKRIQSRWKSAVVHAATRGNADGSTNNPLRSFASPPSTPGDLNASTVSTTDLKPTSSFEVEQDNANSKNGHPRRPPPKTILAIKAAWAFMTKPPSFKDFTDSLFKRRILLHRASCALLARHELIIGSMVMHIILALLFGWVNKNVTAASVIAYLGIGSMFLLIANAQFIFYMFTNYHVFLKEHSRDLYSSYTNYTVHSMPMYLLKIINAVLFTVVSWGMMDVDTSTGTFGFMILCFIFVVLAGTMVSEIAVIMSDSLEAAYIAIGVVAALQFVASGLILKAGSFPTWLRPWVPSLSMLRWIMQAGFIKVYNGNTDAFPVLPFPGVSYTQYNAYLNLFGWGGKTEWYCFGMLVLNVVVFRFLTFLSTAYKAFKRRGTHKEKIFK